MTPDGIHPPFEAVYIEAMLWHTSSAEESIKVVALWMKLAQEEDERALELPMAELFEHLQNILHQAGCVSRYLFPPTKRSIHVARAKRLREGLNVADDNPLAERGLRNALEHFDERIDVYLDDHRVGQFIPAHVGYELPESEVPLHIFKGFYTGPLTFVLLGTPYQMAPIVNEMLRVHELLLECSRQGHRLPYRNNAEQN
jgi:hypothetical protein